MKTIIIGGVAGGASCAARLRRLDEDARIVIYEKSSYISYANCGLPYYIGDVITDKDRLTLQSPKSFHERFRIEVKVRHEVLSIDADKKEVTVRNLDNDELFTDSYDKLVIATGARPFKPQLAGIDDEKIFTLRNVEDTYRLKDYLNDHEVNSAIVVGGGFIGLEMAENLSKLGIKVCIVEMADHLMPALDKDMASFVNAAFIDNGVSLKLSKAVKGFADKDGRIVTSIEAEDLVSDIVILSTGVIPDDTLARTCGLKTGIRGAIITDEHMRSSNEDIYAAGDTVQIRQIVSGKDVLIPLAGPANKQGRVAADNIAGIASVYKGSAGSSVCKIFSMTVATTGLNEKQAAMEGIDYDKIVLSPSNHASYYPGSKAMTMKVLFEKESFRLLGCQIVGEEGCDKRIDVMATAIQAGLSGLDLKDLDLAYAPPYSSAKDPVNMAGFMIENIAYGLVRQFHYEDLARLPENINRIDVRTPSEYAKGHVEGFINIPVDDLRERISEIDISKDTYVMCQSALRSYIACRILSQKGYNCFNFSGGYRFYNAVSSDHARSENIMPCGMEI